MSDNQINRARIESIAEKLIKKGKFQDAIEEYKKLLTGDEQDINIRNIISDIYIKLKKNDKAVEELKRIATFYESCGNYSKAIAIYKRISRLVPEDWGAAKKLASIYRDHGFTSEARSEYLNLAKKFLKENNNKEAIRTYELLVDLSPTDIESRLTLAELYEKEGQTDKGVEELNEVAEYQIQKNNFSKAKEILSKAKTLNNDHTRTLGNLIDIFEKEDKKKEAIQLANQILRKDKENLKALNLLGDIYFKEGDYKKAEEVFLKIITLRPKDADVRIKLGKIYILEDKLDYAFRLYEPLVETLMRKQIENKAIGLLGLILSAKKPHLPTLEKLAHVYKAKNQTQNLEIVYRIILEEYKKKNLAEKQFALLEEMVRIFPERKEYYEQYKKLKEGLGVLEEAGAEDSLYNSDKIKKIIEDSLAKVDLYVEQGLIKNAMRILENLRMKFPDENVIEKKIESIRNIPIQVNLEEIPKRIENVSKKETVLFGEKEKAERLSSDYLEDDEAEKLTAADIFAETDIIPIVSLDTGEKEYYDLSEKIREEFEAIKEIYSYQIRGDTTIVEKALNDIVAEFRKALDEKVDKKDYESRYNLGIVFIEQGLFDEAIKEFKLAAQNESLTMDSYSALSICYRNKKDFDEALKWLEKAQNLLDKGTFQFFALKYEEASIYEQRNNLKKALKLYSEVEKWNPEYREVSKKIEELKNKLEK
ncbi:MAG: tetratricopeptide repeat protein [Candidatus Aminicenantes bacterium]|nr:tetratricopeptide repeat protein [Candidatus Aminicenantes bacterium]